MVKEIADYIEAAKAHGLSDEQIRGHLAEAGWDENQINESFSNPKSPAPAASLPGQGNIGAVKTPRSKKPIIIAGAAVLVVALGIGGYFGYAYYTNSDPQENWDRAVKNYYENDSSHFKIEGTYTDQAPEDLDEEVKNSDFLGFGSGDLTLSFGAEGDLKKNKATEEDFIASDFNVKTTLGAKLGGLNITFTAEARKIGNDVFYNLKDNPLAALGFAGDDKTKNDWVKINLKELNKRSEKDDNWFLELNNNQMTELKQTLSQITIVKPIKLLGTEEIHGASTMHYQAEINKVELARAFKAGINVFYRANITDEDVQQLIDKLEFKRIEIWIGQLDKQIHQILIETNFPSIVYGSLGQARDKSRNAKRLADVRQIMTALELYYNDNNQYPASLNELTPKYISVIPSAPTPAEGQCTEAQNKYTYSQVSNGTDYALTFCLGRTTGGLSAGVGTAKSSGITSSNPAGVTAPPDRSEYIDELMQLPFTATATFKVDLSEFNTPVQIEEPTDVLDFFQSLDNSEEIQNVRTIVGALKNFKADHGSYPNKLEDLKTKRLGEYNFEYLYGKLKTAYNTTGECEGADAYYNYKPTDNGANFSMEFCITDDVNEYSGKINKGRHKIDSSWNPYSQSGVQLYLKDSSVLGILLEALN